MSYLSAENITFLYGSTTVLRNQSLYAEQGECLCLTGPSGIGKTTMLKIVAGLLRPSSGRVTLKGTDITDRLPSDRGMAMVFQNAALFPNTRIRDNIGYGLHRLGYTRNEIDEMTAEAAKLLRIEDQLGKYPGALSGGQLQRAGIARAVVRRPEILLLDEPFSSLDKPLRSQLVSELDAIRKDRGMTMIYVTHDLEEIRDYADRILELKPAGITN